MILGIVNWKDVAKSFGKDFINMGGKIFLNNEVQDFVSTKIYRKSINDKDFNDGIRIKCSNMDISSEYVITCCGMYSDNIARMSGSNKLPMMLPLRGEYLVLKDSSPLNSTLKTNIYPVPVPNMPWLGVHFTPRINDSIILGPTGVLAFAKEGYNFFDINIKELFNIITFRGFRIVFNKYKYQGFDQLYRNIFWSKQVKQLQRYVPSLTMNDIDRNISMSGIRAQALDNNGAFIDDFVFDTNNDSNRFLHVRNAPSPGATSSLAIAKMIVSKADKDLFRSKAF